MAKEETTKTRSQNEINKNQRTSDMSRLQRRWDSRSRKKWKRLNRKNKKEKEDTKREYENTIWNRIEGKTKKIKNKLKFATLNIQGINSLGKRQEIERWMEKRK